MSVQFHHTGMTVSDLDRSAEFYKLFGLEEASRFVLEGDEWEAAVAVPGAVSNFVMLRGTNTVLELIQYSGGAGGRVDSENNDVGAAHVCFTVEDLDDTLQKLEAAGVTPIGPPTTPNDGTCLAFVRDPDGRSVEILQVGPGATLESMGVKVA